MGHNHCLERISVNPKIMNGKAVIKGTRIPVFIILEFLKSEYSIDDVLEIYPSLLRKDIKVGVRYATEMMKNKEPNSVL